MIRLLLTLCMCLLAAMLIWGDGPGLSSREAAPSVATQPDLHPVAYTPSAEPVSDLPLVLPLIQTNTPPPEAETVADLRYITASSVNVREGPSTQYPVIGRLSRGEATRLLWLEENGWARITLEGDGITGFVSGDFLSDAAP